MAGADNAPVAIQVQGDTVVCTGPVEALTGMEKKITVKMANNTASQYTTHLLTLGASAKTTQP